MVENFHDLRDEIINMKNITIKKLQDENVQFKETIANLQRKVITLETVANSVEQYDRRNNIEITGILDNVGDKNFEHSVIEVFKLPTFKFPITIKRTVIAKEIPKVIQERPSWHW